MKRKDFLTEVRGMAKADLQARARSLGEELMKLRFRKASGQLQHGHVIGQVKRNLARVMTAMKSAESSK